MASEFRLTGRLEGGELAELYRAEQVGGGPVVVKLFHTRTTNALYAREIADTQNKLLNVTNPGIAHVVGIGLVKGRLAIVREDSGRYTLGQALQRLATKEVVMAPALAIVLVIDMLEAVADAHGAGVVHGALTPGNVLLSGSRASVSDFGALAALNASPALKKNFAGRGRSSYRAPEITQGEALSMQADIYSLGAMMYEILTLKEPSTSAAQVSTRREALPPPSRLDRRLNSRIDPIVLRALEQAPNRRYKSALEFASALREFLTYGGGAPGREELAKFNAQLFPNEVQISEGEVPFQGAFALESVEGAQLEESDERSMVVMDRKSFSGGTFDNLEAVDVEQIERARGDRDKADRPTIQMAAVTRDRERGTDWHAPPAAMPATARSGAKEAVNAEVFKRVKRIEDFEGKSDETQPTGNPLSSELPKAFPGRADDAPPPQSKKEKARVAEERANERARHVATPADSQPISGENVIVMPDGKKRRMITEERNIARIEGAAKKWVPIVAGAAVLALAFLFLGMWRWSGGDDGEQAVPPPPPRPRSLPTVKLPHAERTAPTPPPPTKNCYQPPKQNFGFVAVAADRPVWVKIDSDYVCGTHDRVPASVGSHAVAIVDIRTKEEYVTTTVRIELNRVAPVVPSFRGR